MFARTAHTLVNIKLEYFALKNSQRAYPVVNVHTFQDKRLSPMFTRDHNSSPLSPAREG